jgi:hypothetical protein
MMFIVRTDGPRPDLAVKMTRRARDGSDRTDYFCVGDPAGSPVLPVHDGWYADDTGGGVAIFGQGRFWEVRDTPFSVTESDDGAAEKVAHPVAEIVNVRGAIFGV